MCFILRGYIEHVYIYLGNTIFEIALCNRVLKYLVPNLLFFSRVCSSILKIHLLFRKFLKILSAVQNWKSSNSCAGRKRVNFWLRTYLVPRDTRLRQSTVEAEWRVVRTDGRVGNQKCSLFFFYNKILTLYPSILIFFNKLH